MATAVAPSATSPVSCLVLRVPSTSECVERLDRILTSNPTCGRDLSPPFCIEYVVRLGYGASGLND